MVKGPCTLLLLHFDREIGKIPNSPRIKPTADLSGNADRPDIAIRPTHHDIIYDRSADQLQGTVKLPSAKKMKPPLLAPLPELALWVVASARPTVMDPALLNVRITDLSLHPKPPMFSGSRLGGTPNLQIGARLSCQNLPSTAPSTWAITPQTG